MNQTAGILTDKFYNELPEEIMKAVEFSLQPIIIIKKKFGFVWKFVYRLMPLDWKQSCVNTGLHTIIYAMKKCNWDSKGARIFACKQLCDVFMIDFWQPDCLLSTDDLQLDEQE